jgi:hypothetical protein
VGSNAEIRGTMKNNCLMCGAARKRFKTFCDACTSWWYRMQMKTPEELALYLKKQDRMSRRIMYWRSRRSHGKKAA